jgi:hypothetical protein
MIAVIPKNACYIGDVKHGFPVGADGHPDGLVLESEHAGGGQADVPCDLIGGYCGDLVKARVAAFMLARRRGRTGEKVVDQGSSYGCRCEPPETSGHVEVR